MNSSTGSCYRQCDTQGQGTAPQGYAAAGLRFCIHGLGAPGGGSQGNAVRADWSVNTIMGCGEKLASLVEQNKRGFFLNK
jgi:hypothetical protein